MINKKQAEKIFNYLVANKPFGENIDVNNIPIRSSLQYLNKKYFSSITIACIVNYFNYLVNNILNKLDLLKCFKS